MPLFMQSSAGAVIVDPATKEVIAQAHTDADHPTRHAVMVCIDNVAKRQGGGAWSNHSEDKEQGLFVSRFHVLIFVVQSSFVPKHFHVYQ